MKVSYHDWTAQELQILACHQDLYLWLWKCGTLAIILIRVYKLFGAPSYINFVRFFLLFKFFISTFWILRHTKFVYFLLWRQRRVTACIVLFQFYERHKHYRNYTYQFWIIVAIQPQGVQKNYRRLTCNIPTADEV